MWFTMPSANSVGITFNNNTGLGYNADCTASHQVRIGNADVTSIGGFSNWTNISDLRFKNNIKEDVKGLDFIMNLRPVTYYFDKDKADSMIGTEDISNYPEKYDIEKIKQSGFLAQEVDEAANDSKKHCLSLQ